MPRSSKENMAETVAAEELVCVPASEAAVGLEIHFKGEAYRLEPRDWALREDIVQEMRLSVLQYREAMSLSFFKETAKNHAIDFLKRWRRHSRIPYGTGLAWRMSDTEEVKTSEEQHMEESEKEERVKEAIQRSMFYERTPKTKTA